MNKPYLDSKLSPEERAKLLLAQLSLDEKMGQVVCFFPRTPNLFEGFDNYPNGVGQVSLLVMREMENMEQCVEFQRTMQEKAMAASPHNIPAIFHMEAVCGAYIPGAASFPYNVGRGSSWNPDLEEKIGQIIGRQERALGITHTFAPVLDVAHDARFGRCGEAYSEDAALTAAFGSAFTKGVQADSTGPLKSEAVAKHFLGSHHIEGGIHGTHCEIPSRLLREVYAKPFQAAITEAGLKGIMPSYNSINGEPVSASEEILTDLLRGDMGFDGLAVSDYSAVNNIHCVQKVCENKAEAGFRAMTAGMDMELQSKVCFGDELAELFLFGKADTAILDRAVLRVLTAKFRMGLFENPFTLDGDELQREFFDSDDKSIMLQAARESLVLLKNDGALPIKKDIKRIAVIGCHAESARYHFGGYSHVGMAEGVMAEISTMAGLASAKGEKAVMETVPGTPIQADSPKFEAVLKRLTPDAKSLLEQLKIKLPDAEIVYSYGYPFAGDDISGHMEALETARNADFVILTLGGKNSTGSIASMGEGVDTTDVNLPACQELFIEKLAELGKPSAAVHFNGRPISSDAADRHVGAILEAWNPSEMGADAIVDVLLGDYNPGGKLPISVAYNTGQIPVYYNHPNGSSYHQGESIAFSDYVDLPHTPRYYFGHGLSYTTFKYSNLKIDKKEVAPYSTVDICVDVTNTGSAAGDEVVQLYLRDRYASMTRPVMELVGFKRLYLLPGERKKVRFVVDMSQTAFLDRKMKWKIEAGDIDVFVGASSADIRLEDSFKITDDLIVDGKTRGFYAKAEVL